MRTLTIKIEVIDRDFTDLIAFVKYLRYFMIAKVLSMKITEE